MDLQLQHETERIVYNFPTAFFSHSSNSLQPSSALCSAEDFTSLKQPRAACKKPQSTQSSKGDSWMCLILTARSRCELHPAQIPGWQTNKHITESRNKIQLNTQEKSCWEEAKSQRAHHVSKKREAQSPGGDQPEWWGRAADSHRTFKTFSYTSTLTGSPSPSQRQQFMSSYINSLWFQGGGIYRIVYHDKTRIVRRIFSCRSHH